VQLEVGLNTLPQLSEQIGPKSKNATDSTDSKNLTDDTFELERPSPAKDRVFFNKIVKSVAFLF